MKTPYDSGYLNRRGNHLPLRLALPFLLMAAILATTVPPSVNVAQAATKKTDKREIDARKAFAAGHYQEALDLYADLYADKVHPTYLRNVGRCYQNLRQPEKAINAFRDYLRQAKGVTTAERREVEGYIAEMEQLQKQMEAERAAAAAPPPSPNPPPTIPVLPPVAPAGPAGAGAVELTSQPPAAPPPTPVYKKAWFWGVVGVAVAGAVVGGLYAGGAFSKSSIPCTVASGCK